MSVALATGIIVVVCCIVAVSPIGILGHGRWTYFSVAARAGPESETRLKTLMLALLGMALAAAVGLGIVSRLYNPAGLSLEIAKALLNVLTVAIAAQVVAFLIAQYNELRRKQREADQFRLRTLLTLTRAFIAAKRARRLARAESEPTESADDRNIQRSRYFKCLGQLNEVQLQLEELAKDIENRAALFPEGKALFDSVSAMEQYLNGLVDEWENPPTRFSGNPPSVLVSQLPCLADLIGPYKASKFRPEFVHEYYSSVERIRASLSLVKAANWKPRSTNIPADRTTDTAA